MSKIVIGASAGHHFHGQADLEVVYHCSKGEIKGYYHCRKRLVNRAAFNFDPSLGWSIDRWFEWLDKEKDCERVSEDSRPL